MIHRILIAMDDTATALNAADYGIDLAKKIKAKIAVIYVAEPLINKVGREAVLQDADKKTLQRRHGNLMDEIDITHPYVDIKEFDPVLRPRDEIQNAIERWKPDLLVIGHQTHRLFQRVFGPSVEKHLTGQIKIPLLIIPEQFKF